MTYMGAHVSSTFTSRWRSRRHIGPARPWMEVKVRRGHFTRKYHDDWPNPQFGQIVGRSIHRQWYPTWTALDDWTVLDTCSQVDLDQSFDNNGVTVATIDIDNEEWRSVLGAAGQYHTHERGVFWPWRGWVPPHRPGSGDARNLWWDRLPNAQILVRQGYGPDTAVKTFTGLIDTYNAGTRPDHMTITARDFGGMLVDCPLFGWNKDRLVPDPVTFIPHNYWRLPFVQHDGKSHRWVKIKDATDIVRCILRWAGFKEWEVENSGVDLSTTAVFDKSKTYMDVINAVKEQLGYVFFMGEPTNDDLSIGVPIFRRASLLIPGRSQPVSIRDQDLLTDIKPQHDNKDDRHIIRVRGQLNDQTGKGIDEGVAKTAAADNMKRVTFVYFPPWSRKMSGVFKQITYYNVGSGTMLGFTSNKQCAVAATLIALQIGLARDTATLQTPGNPKLGLDTFAYVTDAGTGIASRLYISNRKSTMQIGGSGSGQVQSGYGSGGGSQGELIWATEIGGALCDNPEMETIVTDYHRATMLQPDGKPPPGGKRLSAGGV